MPFSRRQSLILGAGSLGAWALPGCRGPGQSAPAPQPASATVLQKFRGHRTTDGDGATLERIFPGPVLRHLDPFVLLDHFDVRKPAGFPTHPHRGFEAFTYMLEGAFEHADTMGNESRVGPGGTQRFNSGAGAKHSEMPGTDGPNRGLQLWVNLPQRMKKMTPEYGDTQAADMPVEASEIRTVRTVAGGGSPVALHTEVDYMDITMHGQRLALDVPTGRNTLVYVLEGSLTLGSHTARRGEGLLVSAGQLELGGAPGMRFIYLSGAPHDEPIRHRGPFVD